MDRLQFCDYHNMVAILEKGEFNTDFHPMVDFIAASLLRIETTDEGTYILAIVDGIQRTVSESSLRRNLKLRDEDGIGEGSSTPTEPHHTPSLEADTSHPTADEPASPMRDVSEREACPTESGFIADQDRETIAKSSTLPHDLAPRVTSHVVDEGKVEFLRLKERVQVLEDKEGVAAKQSRYDAPIKGRSINEGEAAAERISNDSEDIARVLTSMDAATVLAGGIDVPTISGSIPTAGLLAIVISIGSEVGPTASPIVTSYSRRKGKEVIVEFDTPKKQRLQE
uniref:Uncharacterized protein n=1 Tax=Tanacetum cinerariifolium TaxID=118510 RepID=A0A6L2N414_TANCI|nr:hypothetical protein [Tanacetum cinerariifolium]